MQVKCSEFIRILISFSAHPYSLNLCTAVRIHALLAPYAPPTTERSPEASWASHPGRLQTESGTARTWNGDTHLHRSQQRCAVPRSLEFLCLSVSPSLSLFLSLCVSLPSVATLD